MLNGFKGLLVTLRTALRRPVTAHYPDQHIALQERYMGFPALTYDHDVGEPYCVGCMVCVRLCPTQCMSATMVDNPLHAEQKSPRRKIASEFEINLGRCILCGICVEVCNFDAIVMSHEHELSTFQRNGRRIDLPSLIDMGKKFQHDQNWAPKIRPAKKQPPTAPASNDLTDEEST